MGYCLPLPASGDAVVNEGIDFQAYKDHKDALSNAVDAARNYERILALELGKHTGDSGKDRLIFLNLTRRCTKATSDRGILELLYTTTQ